MANLVPEYGKDWTQPQVEAVVTDYFAMLAVELADQPYNKAEHNRALQKLIGRSHGSIERKHQNVSAVLRELGMPWIPGYKPLGNYQQLLFDVVETQLAADQFDLEVILERIVSEPVEPLTPPVQLGGIEVSPPRPTPKEYTVQETGAGRQVTRRKDYLAIDARNRALGAAGEEFMLEYERRRLWDAGRRDLADRIEHVAATQGDGLGYDVASFELDGNPRLIEVKTTRFAALTPFFVSRNEVSVSNRRASHYRLCRLFNFRTKPQFFALPGSLQQTCWLEPEQFLARVG